MRSEDDVNRAIDNYGDMIKRICFCHLKSKDDSDDIFQNVFLKYMMFSGTFENEEHIKAWFIRVTINACKDFLKSIYKWKTVSLDEAMLLVKQEDNHSEVLHAVLELPIKYRDVIYLHYYEQYSAIEIAKILHIKENTVYSLLSRGRKMLKERLGEIDE